MLCKYALSFARRNLFILSSPHLPFIFLNQRESELEVFILTLGALGLYCGFSGATVEQF